MKGIFWSVRACSLWFALMLGAGCTSYQKTSLEKIEAHPDKVVNKNVRVYLEPSVDSVAVTGRTARERQGGDRVVAPDSLVSLRVRAVTYPVLTGYYALKYEEGDPKRPIEVSLQGSRKVEVLQFIGVGRILLDVAMVGLVVGLMIYAETHLYGDAISISEPLQLSPHAMPLSQPPRN